MTDNTEQQAVGGDEAFSSVVQEIGDICHESYIGCQKTDRLIKEYDYCYTDEVINLLDDPRVKAAISRHYIAKEAIKRQRLEAVRDWLQWAYDGHEPLGDRGFIEQCIDSFNDALNLDSGTEAKQ